MLGTREVFAGGFERLGKLWGWASQRFREFLSSVKGRLPAKRSHPVPVQAAGTFDLIVQGMVLSKGKGDIIFGAQVRSSSGKLTTQTDKAGHFRLVLARVPKGSSQSIRILFPDYWPNRVAFEAKTETVDLPDIALEPVPEIFRQTTIGVVLSYFGPKLVYLWFSSTLLEKALAGLVLLLMLPPAALFAIDRGLKIPGTDFDEVVREQIQRIRWLPSSRPTIRYSEIRPVYYAGIRYQFPSGVHQVDISEVVVQQGSELKIEPSTTLRMTKGAQILVKGKLTAIGEEDGKIKFVALDGEAPWGNITLFGEGASGSVFRHCEIRSGSGRGVVSSDTGYFALEPKSLPVGGGLLVFNAAVTVSDTLIANCSAVTGGGIYIRNSPKVGGGTASTGPSPEFPGPRFSSVHVENCSAKGSDKSAGGALMIKESYPEFKSSKFNNNSALGSFSCGGAVYVGVGARAAFDDCAFEQNTASAEGGAVYAFMARDFGDQHRSGVVVRDCRFQNNQASGSGGAISTYNSRVGLSNSKFLDNRALKLAYINDRVGAIGGGVFLDYDSRYKPDNPIVIERCVFKRNQVFFPAITSPNQERSFAGGGLAISSRVSMNNDKLILRDLEFEGNEAYSGSHVALPALSLYAVREDRWGLDSRFALPGLNDPRALYRFPTPEEVRGIRPPTIVAGRELPPDCYDDRPPGAIVRAAIVHFISAVDIDPKSPYDLDKILGILKGESTSDHAKLSAHYLIDRAGTIYRLVDEAKRAWHAGLSRMPGGDEEVNAFSIGIEMVRRAVDDPTDAQYEALACLVCDIKRRHQLIPKDAIVGHDMIRALWNRTHPERQGPAKPDPGPLFHWSRLFKRLDELGFDAAN